VGALDLPPQQPSSCNAAAKLTGLSRRTPADQTPALVHSPELGFFRDFLEQFQIPPAPETSAAPTVAEQVAAGDDDDAAELDEGCVPPDEPDEAQEMGDPSHEPTDDEIELVSQAKMAASEALGNGDVEAAVAHYGTAIKLMPSALAFANRANAFLKLQRPNAAIKDCDAAIQLNPDSAKAYKMRGKAHRMLGQWEAAARDLGVGQTIDFDESLYELQKLVEHKAKLIAERRAKK